MTMAVLRTLPDAAAERGPRARPTIIDARLGVGKAERALRACLEQVPFLRVKSAGKHSSLDSTGLDSVFELECPSGKQVLLLDARSSGERRIARAAINQLLRFRAGFP